MFIFLHNTCACQATDDLAPCTTSSPAQDTYIYIWSSFLEASWMWISINWLDQLIGSMPKNNSEILFCLKKINMQYQSQLMRFIKVTDLTLDALYAGPCQSETWEIMPLTWPQEVKSLGTREKLSTLGMFSQFTHKLANVCRFTLTANM